MTDQEFSDRVKEFLWGKSVSERFDFAHHFEVAPITVLKWMKRESLPHETVRNYVINTIDKWENEE